MSFDISCFNDFFDEYHRRFTRFAYSYVRDSAIAEDLVMDSAMAFWDKRDSLPTDTNIPAFVLTVLKNKCLDYLRHLKVTQATSSYSQLQLWDIETRYHNLESFDPEEVFKKEIMAIVSRTLSSLPQKTRDIFMMSRYENKKYREIADQYGMSVKGVEFHIGKALDALKAALADYLTLSIVIFFLS